MTMAAATTWVSISVSFEAVSKAIVRSGTTDNAVRAMVVFTNAERGCD